MTKQQIMISKQKQICYRRKMDYVKVEGEVYIYKCTVEKCALYKICKHNNWEKVSDCYGCMQVISPKCKKGIPCCECFEECNKREICQILQ